MSWFWGVDERERTVKIMCAACIWTNAVYGMKGYARPATVRDLEVVGRH